MSDALGITLFVAFLVSGCLLAAWHGQRLRVRSRNVLELRYLQLRAMLIIYGLMFTPIVLGESLIPGRPLFQKFFWLGCFAVGFAVLLFQFLRTRKKYLAQPVSTRRQSHRETLAFFWHAILILLPVIGLAAFGLYSLRQDRIFAEQEAREAGQILAQRLVQAIRLEGSRKLHDYSEATVTLELCRTFDLGLSHWDAVGESNAWESVKAWQQANPEINISPLPPARALGYYLEEEPETTPPRPPGWLAQLTSRQQQLWQAVRAADLLGQDLPALQSAIEIFLASNPPPDARANAEYLSLLAQTQGLPAPKAAAMFAGSKWSQSDQATDAGLPVGQLIWYQRLHLMTGGQGLSPKDMRSLSWSINYRPSFFSPRVIAEASRVTAGTAAETNAAALQAWWTARENTHLILEGFRAQYPTNTWKAAPFWVNSRIGQYLLLLGGRVVEGTNGDVWSPNRYSYFLCPKLVVEKALATAMVKSQISVPPYALAEFEWGAKRLVLPSNLAGTISGDTLPLLAQGNGTLEVLASPGPSPFHINVFLASPEILYARQRQRTWLFGALIVASAMVALVGLIAARRAFHRQLQLNEQKSNFVSSVSHELRAPIASVRLMAENLERGKVSEPARQGEYFRHIVQECRRLSSLIENVLDFSRIEQGRKQYEFEPTNLLALMETTVALMQPYAAERGVTLKLEPSSQKIELNVDGRAIQQALINLIDNAVKHSPKGQTVAVGLENAAASVHLYVADHGPGIPPAEHEKIFERFYRLGSELRRETQGVGIGLSVVKHIVEAHRGCVRVSSSVGHGSRFTIELPAK